MEYVYLSLIISIIYFILKFVLDKDKEDDIKKNNMRDSAYVGIISFAVLYGSNYFFSKDSSKTQVFTNEPGF